MFKTVVLIVYGEIFSTKYLALKIKYYKRDVIKTDVEVCGFVFFYTSFLLQPD